MSLSISAFAYVGVEIVGASALEARWPGSSSDSKPEDRAATDLSRRSNEQLIIGKTVKLSALYLPVAATVIYVVGGVLAAFDMPRDDCRLPRLSWVDYSSSNDKCFSSSLSSSYVISDSGDMISILTVDPEAATLQRHLPSSRSHKNRVCTASPMPSTSSSSLQH